MIVRTWRGATRASDPRAYLDEYDDLARFVSEQELLRRLAAESRLPVREFDLSDDDVEGACGRIADWLESTGGLWAPP
jgi:hypothetical protein